MQMQGIYTFLRAVEAIFQNEANSSIRFMVLNQRGLGSFLTHAQLS